MLDGKGAVPGAHAARTEELLRKERESCAKVSFVEKFTIYFESSEKCSSSINRVKPLFLGFPSAPLLNSKTFFSVYFAATLKNECPLTFSSITRSYSDIRRLSSNRQQVSNESFDGFPAKMQYIIFGFQLTCRRPLHHKSPTSHQTQLHHHLRRTTTITSTII